MCHVFIIFSSSYFKKEEPYSNKRKVNKSHTALVYELFLEIFYKKIIKLLIFPTIFYIFHENDIINFPNKIRIIFLICEATLLIYEFIIITSLLLCINRNRTG